MEVQCACAAGYRGAQCQLPVDDGACASRPCLNGATCMPGNSRVAIRVLQSVEANDDFGHFRGHRSSTPIIAFR